MRILFIGDALIRWIRNSSISGDSVESGESKTDFTTCSSLPEHFSLNNGICSNESKTSTKSSGTVVKTDWMPYSPSIHAVNRSLNVDMA
ncbi:hypothetical protein OGAPHI_004792 [Ogataea philodendri]|uniref:Uncharacterized protein n=1 Tax=Ogataea philodendri TaxID=1378263 RepID=A0A9P8P202_9ASCO|nr:uncharacterized protein OGAPHI_004792 [Ogataea philodendri]KAH3664078.1 hypothetical protein OGAPHI_004792 [Ogataea philodendri]